MANLDKPNGLKPVGTLNGNSWCGKVMPFDADGAGSDIFPGDLVKMEADGKIDVATAGDVELVGVCVGYQPAQPGRANGVTDHFTGNASFDLDRTFYDASVDGAAQIMVAVGPEVLYEVQTAGTLAATNVGNNADVVATAGDVTRGISQQELSGTAGSATAQLRIIRAVDRTDNDVTAANSRWIVKINESHYTKLAGI